MNIAVVHTEGQSYEIYSPYYRAINSLDNRCKREMYKKPADSPRLDILYTFIFRIHSPYTHVKYLLNIMYTLEESSSQSRGIYNIFLILYLLANFFYICSLTVQLVAMVIIIMTSNE